MSAIGSIKITDLGRDGATVAFPRNSEMILAFKAHFPKARWHPHTGVWGIPGVLAARRAALWAEKVSAGDTDIHRLGLIGNAEFDGITSPYVKLTAEKAVVKTPYDPTICSICKRLGGKYDERARIWLIDGSNLAGVIAAIPRIHELATTAQNNKAKAQAERGAAEHARAERQKSKVEAERPAEKRAQDEQATRIRARRFIVLATDAPMVGSELNVGGRAARVERLGQPWMMDDTLAHGVPASYGGQMVRFVYWF